MRDKNTKKNSPNRKQKASKKQSVDKKKEKKVMTKSQYLEQIKKHKTKISMLKKVYTILSDDQRVSFDCSALSFQT